MTHGMHNTPTYHAWENMKARCLNPRHPSFKDYGARGVHVCERWLTFENFYADMGKKPESLTLEREKNDGDYCRENCKWATRTEQQSNRRVSRFITFDDRTQTAEAWAREFGLPSGAFHNRIFQLGWSMEKAKSTPIKMNRRSAL